MRCRLRMEAHLDCGGKMSWSEDVPVSPEEIYVPEMHVEHEEAPPPSESGVDPAPPFLFVDLYPLDIGPNPPWSVLTDTPGHVGAILKAMEGTGYADKGWLKKNWQAV